MTYDLKNAKPGDRLTLDSEQARVDGTILQIVLKARGEYSITFKEFPGATFVVTPTSSSYWIVSDHVSVKVFPEGAGQVLLWKTTGGRVCTAEVLGGGKYLYGSKTMGAVELSLHIADHDFSAYITNEDALKRQKIETKALLQNIVDELRHNLRDNGPHKDDRAVNWRSIAHIFETQANKAGLTFDRT